MPVLAKKLARTSVPNATEGAMTESFGPSASGLRMRSAAHRTAVGVDVYGHIRMGVVDDLGPLVDAGPYARVVERVSTALAPSA